MSLSTEDAARLAALQARRDQLEKVYYGGATEVVIDGLRVSLDPEAARKALVDTLNAINTLLGVAPARATWSTIRMDGNYSDDASTSVTDSTP